MGIFRALGNALDLTSSDAPTNPFVGTPTPQVDPNVGLGGGEGNYWGANDSSTYSGVHNMLFAKEKQRLADLDKANAAKQKADEEWTYWAQMNARSGGEIGVPPEVTAAKQKADRDALALSEPSKITDADAFQIQGNAALQRDAIQLGNVGIDGVTVDNSRVDAAYGDYQGSRAATLGAIDQQGKAIGLAEQAALGTAPSVAREQLNIGRDATMNNALSIAATQSARGGGTLGTVEALRANANTMQSTNQQAAMLRAQEMAEGRQQYGAMMAQQADAYGKLGIMDQQAGGLAHQQAMGNAQFTLGQNQYGAQFKLGQDQYNADLKMRQQQLNQDLAGKYLGAYMTGRGYQKDNATTNATIASTTRGQDISGTASINDQTYRKDQSDTLLGSVGLSSAGSAVTSYVTGGKKGE